MQFQVMLRRTSRACRGAVFIVFGALCLPFDAESSTAGAATALASHRAVYDLTLSHADDRSGIAQVQGRLVSEFVGDECDGYTLNMRRILRIVNTEGAVNTFDTVSTSWESGDGNDMRFGSRLYVNGQLSEIDDLEGAAMVHGESGEGTVAYVKPKETDIPLPTGTAFPVEHSRQLLSAARDGQTIERTIVFDGGEFDKIYTAVSFVSGQVEPGSVDLPGGPEVDDVFADMAAWNVAVSYYENAEAGGSEQLPAYEVRVVLFDNGVATDLMLVYEGFSLKGNLKELEIFEAGDCE